MMGGKENDAYSKVEDGKTNFFFFFNASRTQQKERLSWRIFRSVYMVTFFSVVCLRRDMKGCVMARLVIIRREKLARREGGNFYVSVFLHPLPPFSAPGDVAGEGVAQLSSLKE